MVASHHLSASAKERITRIFFEEFGVPGFAIYDAGLLALYAAGVLTGITVDIGYEKTGTKSQVRHFLTQILPLLSMDKSLQMAKSQPRLGANRLLNISWLS